MRKKHKKRTILIAATAGGHLTEALLLFDGIPDVSCSFFAESTQLKDQSVSLRARVIKVSENILGSNWITLQDGTGTEVDSKLLATSTELVSPGDLVIASGIIRN